ncbi:MAG: hypothetical protein KIT02_01140 [Devosia sp.]|uniref:DUF4344 domain-containing metallopeptidase n=1 Tax=Devosia sp. TaxID=1871048 RepID=UPI0024C5CAE4|nr:DUF4344 domain-containing metallopeptidase [Devosia sp.]UYN99875.1 MAG: hypothetical protein KIT02_01140 [Devosia sp.]
MRLLTALVFAVQAMMLAAPAQAQDLSSFSKAERADILRFAESNSLFVLYHEVGHVLIDQLGLPVLGYEEDAADNYATWTLISEGTPDAYDTLERSIKGWLLSGVAYGSGTYEEDYSDGYSLDKERAMQILCLMVGSNGAAFREMATFHQIPRERQDSCRWDYDLVDRSLASLLADKVAGANGGTEVNVTYRDGGRRLRLAERAFRASGVFDKVADHLRHGYRLKNPVTFTARRCDEANAFYDPNTIEIIFCYELMQDFIDLYAADLRE